MTIKKSALQQICKALFFSSNRFVSRPSLCRLTKEVGFKTPDQVQGPHQIQQVDEVLEPLLFSDLHPVSDADFGSFFSDLYDATVCGAHIFFLFFRIQLDDGRRLNIARQF